MKLFEGKSVLITGSARGIGYAAALAYAKEGANLLITATSKERAAAAAGRLKMQGSGRIISCALDITNAQQCALAVEQALSAFGSLDILVNNAGITRDNLLIRMKESEYDMVLDTDLKGAFLMIKAAAKPMLRQRSGRIINIASVVAQAGQAGQANYAAAKAGLIGLTKSLAREFAPRNILVNAIAPGFVKTDMTLSLPQATKDEIKKMIPLGIACEPYDIAAAILFLSGEGARCITGQVLAVNGGMYM